MGAVNLFSVVLCYAKFSGGRNLAINLQNPAERAEDSMDGRGDFHVQ